MKSTYRSCKSARGIINVWVVLTGLMLIAFVGLASDTAYVFMIGHQIQNAADAAALAGAAKVQFSTAQASTDAVAAAAANTANGASVQLTAANDVAVGYFDRTAAVFHANTAPYNAVQVTAHTSVNLIFGPIAGINTSNVSRQAIAVSDPTGAGVIILDQTANPAVQLVGTGSNPTKINVTGGGSVVIDSTSATALQWTGQPYISASGLYITGNDTAVSGSSVFPTGTLALQSPALADPLAALPVPPQGTTQKGKASLNPGYYPNGLPAGTLAAGIYYVDGGITLKGGDLLDGTAGCMIYLHTGGISMTGNSNIAINPPSSGTYAGISFFSDRSNTSSMVLKGTTGASSTGTFYFPASHVSIQGTPDSAAGQFICDTLDVQGNAQLNVNYTGSLSFFGIRRFSLNDADKIYDA